MDISNTSKKVTIVGEPSGNEPSGDEPSGNTTSVNNSTTTADKKIPYTGEQSIAFVIIGGTVLIAVIAYIKYKQYKNI